MSVLRIKNPTTGEWEEIKSIQGPPGQLDGSLSLGIDQTDGLAYVYYNGVRQGTGIAVGGGGTTVHRVSNNLIHVESDNKLSAIQDGLTYRATITPDRGYGNTIVTVTMGGAVVPNAYDPTTGNITVTGVSDDLVITATASLLPIDLLDVTWADHAITVGQDTNSYNAWSPHNMQYDDVHDKWLMLQSHADKHLNHTSSNWTLSVFNPYDPTDVTDVPLPRVFNGVGSLLVENGVWWLLCPWTTDVYSSSDAGQTWVHHTANSALPRLFGVYKVGNKYFAGDDGNNGITYFESDDLINWTTKSFDSALGYSILCETTFCEFGGRFWAFNRTNDAELGHPVILVSDDQGQTWNLFSDQLLHGFRSTVSCLPFQNYIVIADIDRDNGYIYYSKFDGTTIEQLKSWRVPSGGDDFHNINIATNYSDTIVMEFMHGVPFYDESAGLYRDQMACDNVMLVGSTRPLPSVRMTDFASQADFGTWLNANAVTSARSDSTATYDWTAAAGTSVLLYKTVNGTRTRVGSESELVDEIAFPLGFVKTGDGRDNTYLRKGDKLVKPWTNNFTPPRTVWSINYMCQIAIFFINGVRYEYGLKRKTDLPVLIRVDYDYNITWSRWGSNTGENQPDGYEWQADLPFRKVFDVSRYNDQVSSLGNSTAFNSYAVFEYVPAEVE